MPQLIQQSYSPNNSLAKAISSLGDALAPSPANQLAAANVRKMQVQAEIGAQMRVLTERAVKGDKEAAAQLAGLGVQYDGAASNSMPYLRYGGVQYKDNTAPEYRRDVSQTVLATGGAHNTTPLGMDDENAAALQRQEAQNRATIAAARERANIEAAAAGEQQRARLQAEQDAADREPVWVTGADGKTPLLTTKGALRKQALGAGSGAVPTQPAAPGAAPPSASGAPAGVGGPSPAPAAPGGPVNPGFQPRPEASVVTKQMEIDQANALAAQEREAKLNAPVAVIDTATGQRVNVPYREYLANTQRYVVPDDPSVRVQQLRNEGDLAKVRTEAEQKQRIPEPMLDTVTNRPVSISPLDASFAPGRYQPLLNEGQATGALIQRSMQPAQPAPAPQAANPVDAAEQAMVARPAPQAAPQGTPVGNVTLPPGTPGFVADKLRGPVEVKRLEQQGGRADKLSDDYLKAAQGADQLVKRLDEIERLMKTGVQTGPISAALLPVAKVLGELGMIDNNSTAIREAFAGQSNAAVIDALGGSLGAQISNTDRDFMTAIKPSIDKLPESNALTVEILKRMANSTRKAMGEVARFREQNPTATAEQIYSHIEQWRAAQPPVMGDLAEKYGASLNQNGTVTRREQRDQRTAPAAPAADGPPPGTSGTRWVRDGSGNLVRGQ